MQNLVRRLTTMKRKDGAKDRSGHKVFCDPVHDLITFRLPEEELLVKLIDSVPFQRLRRISQLGVTSLVFHGAEHSRFAHSLGVVHLVRRILASLKERHRSQIAWVEKLEVHEPYIVLAALLHDIGHGPYSHLFETVAGFGRRYHKSHEDWTIEILTNPKSVVCQLLLEHHKETPDKVASIIKRSYPSRLAIDLISSQLDGDRLDYLMRDSLMTGTGHGHFDVEWLLRSMLIGERKGRQRLCVDGKRGIQSIEGYAHARHLMHVQVYFHKTGRAFEAQLLNILLFARHLLDKGDKTFAKSCNHSLAKALGKSQTSMEDYLAIDDVVVQANMNEWTRLKGSKERRELAAACRAFYHERKPYGFVALDDEGSLEAAREVIKRLDEELQSGKSLLRFSVHLDTCESPIYKDVDYRRQANGQSDEQDEIVREESIWVKAEDEILPIEEHPSANVIRALSGVSWSGRRLFYDRRYERTLDALFLRCGLSPE